MIIGDPNNNRVGQRVRKAFVTLSQPHHSAYRRPRLCYYPARGIKAADFGLGKRRMQFYLVHGRDNVGTLQKHFKMPSVEVTDAYCTRKTLSKCLRGRLIGIDGRLKLGWYRPMQ